MKSGKNEAGHDRRTFLKTSAVAAAYLAGQPMVHARGSDTLRVGLIGCGGRGRGAAAELPRVVGRRSRSSRSAICSRTRIAKARYERLSKDEKHGGRAADLSTPTCFSGFDAYRAR